MGGLEWIFGDLGGSWVSIGWVLGESWADLGGSWTSTITELHFLTFQRYFNALGGDETEAVAYDSVRDFSTSNTPLGPPTIRPFAPQTAATPTRQLSELYFLHLSQNFPSPHCFSGSFFPTMNRNIRYCRSVCLFFGWGDYRLESGK